MKIYIVGGVVCDGLLGLLVKDCDYVVVGVMLQQLLELGFCLVGKDFLVFFCFDIYEEYVLVCIECKIVFGYKGFVFYVVFDVMLEDDFVCCDFIINVIVQDEDGILVDLYYGCVDFEVCVFCYVFEVFVEDLVCILCVVCFVVCFVDFMVVLEINVFMQCMV